MNQLALGIYETVYDALGADITNAGGFKAVAARLWPTESPAIATQKLRNSVNPEQPHKLAPHEVLAIKKLAREAGSSATVDFDAQQVGYAVTWVDPKDEAEELRRQLRDLLKQVPSIAARIERADERAAGLRAVR